MMASPSQAAKKVSGERALCAAFPAAAACLVNVFDCPDPAPNSSLERPSLLLQGSSSKAVDSEATASGDGVKVSSIIPSWCQLVHALAECTAAFMDNLPRW